MDVSKLYERAQSALERNNLDYAIDLFQQILTIEPNFVVARRAIRAVQRRQVQQKGFPAPAKIVAVLKGIPTLVKIAIFKLTGNHEALMIECEKFLAGYPTSVTMLAWLGSAAREAKYVDSAIVCYEAIVDAHPDNINALKNLGRLYAAKNDVKKAQYFYDEVSKRDPADQEAGRAVRDLAALGTIKRGYEHADGYRDSLKNADEAQDLEDEQRIVRTDDDVDRGIARARKELEEKGEQPRTLAKLGDLLVRKGAFEEARGVYNRAQEIDSADATIRIKLGDLEIKKLTVEAKAIQTQLQAAPDDAALKQQLAAKQKEWKEFALKEYARRVAEHPTDLGLRLQYGKLLYQSNQMDQAIQEFQKAVESPKLRKQTLSLLGDAFMKKGMYDLATAQFERAIADITVVDDDAKNLLYGMGCAQEQLGNLEKAAEHFKRIYETDIGFKDVSEKIENIYRKTREKE